MIELNRSRVAASLLSLYTVFLFVMAPKRANGEGKDEITGREKKKLKVSAARTIAVQPSAGSSKVVASKPLPSSSKPSNHLQ